LLRTSTWCTTLQRLMELICQKRRGRMARLVLVHCDHGEKLTRWAGCPVGAAGRLESGRWSKAEMPMGPTPAVEPAPRASFSVWLPLSPELMCFPSCLLHYCHIFWTPRHLFLGDCGCSRLFYLTPRARVVLSVLLHRVADTSIYV
jgi:hypothetical protein